MAHILDNYYARKIEAAAEAAKESKDKMNTQRMYKKGYSCKDIAECLDKSVETIKKWVEESEAEHSAA